jgi:hypothetical protein
MNERAWKVPQDQFVAAWNAAEALAEAVEKVKQPAGGTCHGGR